MSFKLALSISLVPLVFGGSYAPAPVIQPSQSAYGLPNPNYGNQLNSYGSQSLQIGHPSPFPVAPPPTVSTPSPPVNPPQTYSYPIQPQQTNYVSGGNVYNDQYETTTLPSVPITRATLPLVEKVDDAEKYGVPEFTSNPKPTVVPASQPVPSPALIQSQGGYAPPPQIPAASSAYGAPPTVQSPSYGEAAPYNDLEYSAGEVPSDVVEPGTIPAIQPGAGEAPLNSFYPSRAIRSQKKTAEQRKKLH